MKMKNLPVGISIFVVCAMSYSCKKNSIEPSTLNDQFVAQDFKSSAAGEQRQMGAIMLPAAEYAKLPKADAGIFYSQSGLPATASIATPPIGNQGNEGSCVAWATGYAAR